MDVTTLTPIFSAAIGSAIVGLYWFVTNNVDPTKPTESFDAVKLMVTVIIGAALGALSVAGEGLGITGIQALTSQNVATQMAAYGFIASAVETAIKTITRKLYASKQA
jgi:hypothetical protein